MRRSTRGAADPLDQAVPVKPAQVEEKPVRQRERTTIHVDVDLMERVRNAVYWTPGLTLASMAEEGLWLVLERHEKANGGQFRKRRSELKGGRPVK
jgi:hypothetical protein